MPARETGRRMVGAARRTADGPWMERLGRAGYATKGVLYATIGVLALELAFGRGGTTTGQRGAIDHLSRTAPGPSVVLLVLLAVGLAGLALWRFAQSILDLEGIGTKGKALAKRSGLFVAGVIYSGLFASTLRAITGSHRMSGTNDGARAREWTARLMDVPLGQALVAVVGLIVLGYGVFEAVKGLRRKFEKHLQLEGLAALHAERIRRLSTFGLVSRGFVFAVMGGFLVNAALRHDPSRAHGLGDTLQHLAKEPFGTLLLAVIAVGLVAYAAFSFVEARYRRFPTARTHARRAAFGRTVRV